MKEIFGDIENAAKSKERIVHVIGFGRRFVAMAIDGIVVIFVSFILALLIGMIDVFFGGGVLSWNLIIVLVMLLFSVIYFIGNWVQSTGQTLGKLLMNIKIVNVDGSALTLGKLILRYIGYIISGVFLSIGFFWVALDSKRRGWHDILAKTYVIHISDDLPTDGSVNFIPTDQGKGWIWLVLWVLLAVGAPAVLFAGLWFLGPIVNSMLNGLN